MDQDEQLVQPADNVHDALDVSATQLTAEPPDQGLPRRSSVVDQDEQPLLVDQEEQLVQPADHVHDVHDATELQPEPPDQGLPRRSSRRSVRRKYENLCEENLSNSNNVNANVI